ncbi:MAG: sigma 54-interacting transcriptional regulator [Myxococcota bacterium]|nr:sigma 54-interacting transcriptional regulator [Myxococcota bacterium]MDW8363466.1 sigma 54-interacting transcriptional regulator [Myxococcales bacterium]
MDATRATQPAASPRPVSASLTDWIGTVMRYRAEHPDTARILHVLERLLDRPVRMSVVIHGEPGTGKEGLARALHRAMHTDPAAPFVKVHGAPRDPTALLRELFADGSAAVAGADGGTLYVEGIEAVPPEVQARLSRALRGALVLESEPPRPVDVCVIAATERPLLPLVRRGIFSHELYHRLARLELRIAPLRERPADLGPAAVWVANRLLQRHGIAKQAVLEGEANADDLCIERSALEALAQHDWPGNFRELDAVLERALFLVSNGCRVTGDDVREALAMRVEGVELDDEAFD